VVWSGLTLLWGTDDGHRSWRFAGDTAATLGFVLAMLLTLGDRVMRARLGTVLVAAGAANAVFSIAVFVITHPVFPRLRGWGATTHPILGAAVMATAALTALSRALVPAAPRRIRALNVAAFAVMAVFILMTESRGPLLAGLIGMLLLCAASVWRVRALMSFVALAALWFSLPRAAREHGEAVLVQRGSSHRFQVWDYTLGLIRDRPLFGHGLAANLHLDVGDKITFPHDLYLSLLFYSGIVGFLIFVAMAALLTWRLMPWRWAAGWRDPEWAWLAALWLNLVVVGLTDLGQITKGPGPMWFIVWLPVGLLLTGKGSGGCASSGAAYPQPDSTQTPTPPVAI
jgi:O-antigen ligase